MIRINKHTIVVKGPVRSLVTGLMALQFIILALWQYRSYKVSREVLATLRKLMDDFLGNTSFSRIIFTNRKFYYNLQVPGFPSKILIRNQLGELHRIRPVSADHNRLRILFMSITNRCPLNCRHCYEWDNINKPDPLVSEDYIKILSKFTGSGVGQVHLAGGEPLLKYQCLLELTRFLKGKSEIWIATSGLGLSLEKAKELRKCGLTGANISVDHYDAAIHNEFRGSERSFEWAMAATSNSLEAGLVTGWSICVTREFLSMENLYKYASFAASRGVRFIQLLEPVPVGRYKGRDVLLNEDQLSLLEDFYISYNSDKGMKDKPLITYHGYHQRRIGCMGNGNRYIAIDTWGNLQSCPFCRNNQKINTMEGTVEKLIDSLPKEICSLDKV
jgi:MoaA/NifB/PqqE/SkfB family radical SAM enzyme